MDDTEGTVHSVVQRREAHATPRENAPDAQDDKKGEVSHAYLSRRSLDVPRWDPVVRARLVAPRDMGKESSSSHMLVETGEGAAMNVIGMLFTLVANILDFFAESRRAWRGRNEIYLGHGAFQSGHIWCTDRQGRRWLVELEK